MGLAAKRLHAAESVDKSSVPRKTRGRSSSPRKKPKKLSSSERKQLIVDHMELGERLARSLLSKWRVKLSADEVTSGVGIALCEAASRFDVSKEVSFKTFFFYHLRGVLLKEIGRMIDQQKACRSLPEGVELDVFSRKSIQFGQWPMSIVEGNTPEHIYERRELSRACWDACTKLDPLEQETVIRHFVWDQSLVDIASDLGYCRCHISRVKRKALDGLKDFLSWLKPFDQEEASNGMLKSNAKPAAKKRGRYSGGRGASKERRSFREFQSTDRGLRRVSS